MGYRYRKSKSFGPVRVTASKSGIGFSSGVKGYRVTKKAGGGVRTTISVPGTGISYVKDSSGKSKPATGYDAFEASSSPDCVKPPVDPRVKKYKTAFWWCFGFGLFFLPNVAYLGIPLLCVAAYLFIKKKKVARQIASEVPTDENQTAADLPPAAEK